MHWARLLSSDTLYSNYGICLLIYYIPHADHAFRSVQDIMTRVPYGWLFRQMHVVGSNLLITAVLIHMVTIS